MLCPKWLFAKFEPCASAVLHIAEVALVNYSFYPNFPVLVLHDSITSLGLLSTSYPLPDQIR